METSILTGRNLFVVLAAYFIGCISTGFYIVRFIKGKDIRQLGSGSTGARNVGRILGKPGFIATLGGDILKGVFVAWLALNFGLRSWELMLTIIAAVAGHIFPFQLAFRGGKGLSVALGGMILFDFRLIAIIIPVAILLGMLSRQLTLSLMLLIAIAPVIGITRGYSLMEVSCVSILSLLLLFTHRTNIRTSLGKIRTGLSERKVK